MYWTECSKHNTAMWSEIASCRHQRHRLQDDRKHNWLPSAVQRPSCSPQAIGRLEETLHDSTEKSHSPVQRRGNCKMSSLFASEWSWSFLTGDHRTYDDLWPTEMHAKLVILWLYHTDSVLLAWLKKYERLSVLYYQFEFIQIWRVITIGIACGFHVGSKDDSRDAHLDFEKRPFKGIGCERWNFESCKWREVKPRQDLLQKECHNIALPQYWPAEPWKNCRCH